MSTTETGSRVQRKRGRRMQEIVAVAAELFGERGYDAVSLDDVAERLRALHAVPDGRSDVVAATTTLPEFPHGEIDTTETVDLVVQRLEATVGTMREVHDEVDEDDPTSADILHGIIERLEQFAWMVGAENRTVSR